jgi:uncharacterized integral membrane protein
VVAEWDQMMVEQQSHRMVWHILVEVLVLVLLLAVVPE